MSRRRYSGSQYSNNSGLERAQQHIREAAEFSRELGGTDQDVKSYFFGLDQGRLIEVLDAYGDEYGSNAMNYAWEALPKWRSGQTKMSGMVSERLFNLLPQYMPLKEKYKLVDSLWKHVSPRSKKHLIVGTQASSDVVNRALEEQMQSFIVDWKLPDEMKKRFLWLSDGDVGVQEALNRHLEGMHRQTCLAIAQRAVPEFMARYNDKWQGSNAAIMHTIDVGNQSLVVHMVGESDEISVSSAPPVSPKTTSHGKSSSTNWFVENWWIVVILAMLIAANID